MKGNKKFLFLIYMLVTLLIVAACGSGDSKREESGSGEGTTETEEPKQVKVALQGIPPTLDPHVTGSTMTLEISRPIFETLVAYDADHVPQPMLAESWEISDDQKEVHFKLREGVK